MKLPSLTFIIPTYNNDKVLENVIRQANDVGKRVASTFKIIVCNDASTDTTAVILDNLRKKFSNIRIITHTTNKGYGQTIKELYYGAKSEWLFSIPGDDQIAPREIEKLLPYVNRADMILGARIRRQDPQGRLFQSSVYNLLLRILFGISVRDVNTVRLMKTSILKNIHLRSGSAFVDAELVIQALRNGYTVKEVPIDHQPDKSGGSGGHLGTIFATIIEMIKFRLNL